MKSLSLAFVATAFLGSAASAGVWINELHYDNVGTDANEFVEIVATSDVILADVTITLYNGSGGASYNSINGASLTAGATIGDYTFYSWNLPSNGIQNGAPDGVALDVAGSLVEFLSYEGMFFATNGVANGIESVDIVVAEDSSTPLGSSVGLTGDIGSFTWAYFDSGATKGDINVGQSFVPAPGALALLGLAGLVGGRRRRK